MWSPRVLYLKDQTHEDARRIVEFYLQTARGRATDCNKDVQFPVEFCLEHKLGAGSRKFFGHSYDIVTPQEIIEIDDYKKHSKKNQKINDGIINEYTKTYMKSYKFYRLQKEEIVDSKGRLLDPKDVAEYLREHLF